MKKVIAVAFLLLAVFVLASCKDTEDIQIPSVGDQTTDGSIELGVQRELDPIDDYVAYHQQQGIHVFNGSYNNSGLEYDAFYEFLTYDGTYSFIVDGVYSTMLEIEALKRANANTKEIDEFAAVARAFLDGKNITAVHPLHEYNLKSKNLRLLFSWHGPLLWMFMECQTEAMADDGLYSLFRAYIRYDAMTPYVQNPVMGMQHKIDLIPEVMYTIIPADIKVLSSGIEESTGYRFYEFEFPPNCDVLVNIYQGQRNVNSVFYERINGAVVPIRSAVRLKAGERLRLSPAFEGKVAVAGVTQDGIIGESVLLDVKKVSSEFEPTEVSFASEYLDNAVREYLGKDREDIITTADISGISRLFVSGDTIWLGTDTPHTDLLNLREPREKSDFTFDDLKYFYGLTYLYVQCFPMKDLPRGEYLHVDNLRVVHCGLERIDAVEDFIGRFVAFSFNDIKDASPLENAKYAQNVLLDQNPELQKIKLGDHIYYGLNVKYTLLKDFDFSEYVIINLEK